MTNSSSAFVEKGLKALLILTSSLLCFAYIVGWAQHAIGDFWGFQSGFQLHLATSGIAVLVSLFADTSVLFYFIGTGVWMRDRSQEVAKQASLSLGQEMWKVYETAGKLKAKTFPFATLGLALGVFSFILGGARQVGALSAWIHPFVATLFLLNSLFALRFYFRAIDLNLVYLDKISTCLDDKAAHATS